MNNAEDLRWIAQVILSRDERAFEKLIRKYQSPIRQFFLNLTMGDVFLSDDLAQETFIKAFLYLPTFKALSNFSTWLFRIAYNVYYDAVRARKDFYDLDEKEINQLYQVNNSYSTYKEDFYKALINLNEMEKIAVLLYYMEDKTQREIATIMKCPIGSVKNYIRKGKEKIANFLKENGYGNE